MVGRVTSKRCAACRQRKVKCDLLQPACTQCSRRGLVCPGYDTHGRFYTVYSIHSRAEKTSGSPRPDLTSPTDVLRNEYVFRLNHNQLAARFWLLERAANGRRTALDYIPQRLGESRALDDAVKCVTRSPATGHSYVYAIQSLQKAIDDPATSTSSETLAAATLLYTHELYNSPYQQDWGVHVNGIIALLKTRGPQRMNDDLGVSILRDQVGTILVDAIRHHKHCFLAEPGWNCFLGGSDVAISRPDSIIGGSLRDLIAQSVHLPGLICRFEDFREPDPARLIDDVWRFRQQLQACINNNKSGNQHSSFKSDGLSATVDGLRYALNMAGSFFLLITGFMLLHLADRLDASEVLEGHECTLDLAERQAVVDECEQLAYTTKTRLLAIKQWNPVASLSCSMLVGMAIGRALKVPVRYGQSECSLRGTIQDMYDYLHDE